MTAAVPIDRSQSDSILKPAALLMFGRMLAFAATFFIPVVLVRVFDQAQFGTYKQLFLIQSTLFLVAQVGMATSLYYFLPLDPLQTGRYIANSLSFLTVVGLCCLGVLVAAAPKFGVWMNNATLARYIPWIGLYLFLMMVAAPLEMVLISRHKYLLASASYAISDLSRAAAFMSAAFFSGQLVWLLRGAVIVAGLRVAFMLVYFYLEFPGTLRFDRALLRRQLAYAVPFGAAVLLEILQGNLPAYVVSYLTDPATFAIFAVGCLQIPLVDFAASPTSDVMMVRMQERLAQGCPKAVLQIWHDTTWKLALIFIPLAVMIFVMARDIIVLLFTAKYLASVPIFIAWSSIILLTILQVDGVLRVFAETRLILMLNLVRLIIIGGLLKWSLSVFHLLGPVLVIVLAMLVFKVAALIRMRTLLHVPAAEVLPWRNLASLMLVAAVAAGVTVAVRSQLHGALMPALMISSAVFVAVYSSLVWNLNLLASEERLAVTRMVTRSLCLWRA